LMGERKGNDDDVFFLLPKGSSLNDKIKKWIANAKINKHITPLKYAREGASIFSLATF